MTNEQIILSNRVFLMEQGVIGGTGEMFDFEDENGVRNIEMPEEIHTFQGWKKFGFSVKKGEHSIARFPIWQKAGRSKKEDDEQGDGPAGPDNDSKNSNGRYYQKMSFFFVKRQVEPIKE